jgi:ribosomal-protein-alanine N-acetyltransferase
VNAETPWVPTLEGRHCTLRALTPADAPAIAHHANDPAVVLNLYDGFPHPYTLEEAQRWCGGMHREPHFGKVWAITVAGQLEEAIGCAGLMPKEGMHACNAEVGYWIGRAHWGRGIAADALGLITQWAWAHLPVVQRLVAPIFARNAASQRVARKAGYALEALQPRSLIKGGEAIDVTHFATYRP